MRLIATEYPNGWDETYQYDKNGQLKRQYARDPSNMTNKAIENNFIYDPNGNALKRVRTGAHGQDNYDLTHTYDALNRLIMTKGHETQKNKNQIYTYDSLGNLTYEVLHNKGTAYGYNILNQQIEKLKDGKDKYVNTFDNRGNFIKSVYEKNKNHSYIVEEYIYDATNRMAKGTNEDGEQSHYIYNGSGSLVANEWITAKNAYGYTGVNAPPAGQVGGVVVCDRHQHVTGQGHINHTEQGHTTGGTTGAVTPSINSKQAVVHKDYVLDYTSPSKRVIMESESGAGGLTYRYVYGLEKVEVVVGSIANGAGSVTQYVYDDGTGNMVFSVKYPEQTVVLNSIVKLFYHQDRLGTVDYLTDNVAGKVTSYVEYDDWGALTAKAVLRMGVRELDLVQEYTGHPYDMVLGTYYAKARMYDPGDRRFMAADPIVGDILNPQTLNLYVYCIDNPVLYIDRTGLWYMQVGFNFYKVNDTSRCDQGYVSLDDVEKFLKKRGFETSNFINTNTSGIFNKKIIISGKFIIGSFTRAYSIVFNGKGAVLSATGYGSGCDADNRTLVADYFEALYCVDASYTYVMFRTFMDSVGLYHYKLVKDIAGKISKGNYMAFLKALGFKESSSDYKNNKNPRYKGMYQLGSSALIEAGMQNQSGKWTNLADEKFKVTDMNGFLNNPDAQEYAVREYHKVLWRYAISYGSDKKIGSTFRGIDITGSGLLAAMHLAGAAGVMNMFVNNSDPKDSLGTKASDYLSSFAGYSLSDLLGYDPDKFCSAYTS